MTFTNDFINVRWGLRCDGFITSLRMIGEPSHWQPPRHVQGWDYNASKFRYTIDICRCSRCAVQLYAPSQSVGYSYCDRALWKSHQQSRYETICSMRNSAEAAWCSVFLLYCLVVSECIQPIAFVCSQQAHLYMCVSITSDSIASLPLLLCFCYSCVNCLCCFHCPLTEETCLTIFFHLFYLLLAVLNVELLVVSFLDLFTLSCSISFSCVMVCHRIPCSVRLLLYCFKVKLMMSVSQHLISGDLVLSMLLFLCSSLLTLTGFAWDKYEPDQTKQGRYFEPNQVFLCVASWVLECAHTCRLNPHVRTWLQKGDVL